MAGAEGLEPSTKVLETHVLPLHHTPKHLFSIAWHAGFVNGFQKLLLNRCFAPEAKAMTPACGAMAVAQFRRRKEIEASTSVASAAVRSSASEEASATVVVPSEISKV